MVQSLPPSSSQGELGNPSLSEGVVLTHCSQKYVQLVKRIVRSSEFLLFEKSQKKVFLLSADLSLLFIIFILRYGVVWAEIPLSFHTFYKYNIQYTNILWTLGSEVMKCVRFVVFLKTFGVFLQRWFPVQLPDREPAGLFSLLFAVRQNHISPWSLMCCVVSMATAEHRLWWV